MNRNDGQKEMSIWRQTIHLPRWVVLVQAALIPVVGITGFVYGLMICGLSGYPNQVGQSFDGRVVGRVVWASDGQYRADDGAVVVAIPASVQPDKRYATRTLRPDAFVPLDNAVIQEIRAAGGDVSRTGEDGRFELFLTGPDTFHILVVSNNQARSEGGLTRLQAAELGVILSDPEELVAGQAYSLRTMKLESPFLDVGTIRF